MPSRRRTILGGLCALGAAGCGVPSRDRSAAPLAATIPLPEDHHLFLRITKGLTPNDRDGRLEAFSGPPDGTFALLADWPICTWSGTLGPKLQEGDGQSPEGFYAVGPRAMNPNSSYHLSFNLGFPNAYDRAHGRTGSFLMVHGACVSIGCYAMTDPGIEKIYGLVEQAFANGQRFVRVHAFPFPMTADNMAAMEGHADHDFWRNLQEGWDWFERTGRPPDVTVRDRRYVFAES